jgi:hypothetical protein
MRKLGVVGLVVFLVGCSQDYSRPGALPGSSVPVRCTSLDSVFRTAEKVLIKNYRLDLVDSQQYVLRTAPKEYTSKESVAAVADVLVPAEHTFRRIVTVRVTPDGATGASVSVRVDVQRRDTKAMEAFAYQRQADDRPASAQTYQPIGSNREKSEVWTNIKRDYTEEQKILDAIKACSGPEKTK